MGRLLHEAGTHLSHGGRDLSHGPQNPLWALLGHRVLHSGIVKHRAKMETVPAQLNEKFNCIKNLLWKQVGGKLCAGALCWINPGRLCSHSGDKAVLGLWLPQLCPH